MRYDAVFGFNTKQWWIYDNENNSYIDPPTEVLNKLKEIEYKDDKRNPDEAGRYLEEIANTEPEPDWLHDGNEYFDEDFEI